MVALVRVRLLGPVDVMADDEPRPVSGVRRKAVLATLALQAGEVVSIGRLTEAVWGEAAPATAVNALQSHASYLRRVLGSRAAIVARPPGYVLDLGADGTDVQLAERLLRQGTQSADPAHGVRHLQTALELWRGRPLADLTDLADHAGPTWLEEQAGRLDVLFMQVKRALSEARLAAGEHAQLVPDLEEMAAEHPLDELICAQLMLALYRNGRQADALCVFHRLRHTLSEELGIDPSQRLRDLETAILKQDRSLDLLASAGWRQPTTLATRIPRQLPPSVAAFTGRAAAFHGLDAVLRDAVPARSAEPAAAAVSVISGTAGVGKTALAVHWARRVAEHFPDGQLYVNLRGFDSDDRALDPGDVLCGFLDALGTAVAQYPGDTAARAALYRGVLVGKRVLVVLDNARDADQVRPLLPGSPGCLAIVTSRDELASLVAVEGAVPPSLDLLTAAEAHELLARRLGEERVAGEPEAAQDIIAGCVGLPLALSIAAARAVGKPGFPLAVVASELRGAACALDPFDGGDLAANLRALFSWSYRALSTGASRMFRLLGLHPGPDITLKAAASIAAIPPDQARVLVIELTRAHLLAEHRPGRYASHDLLRAYAAELAGACDSDEARDGAARRMLDHYLHAAHRAATVSQPNLDVIVLAAVQPGVTVTALATAGDALRWFSDENANALAAIGLAAGAGFETMTWQFAWALSIFLQRQGRYDELAKVWRAGLDAARRVGDTTAEAYALRGLAEVNRRSGRHRAAYPLYREALRAFERIGGHHRTQAHIHGGLAVLAELRQRPADMLRHSLRSRELFRLAQPEDQPWILNNIGFAYALLGDYERAMSFCERALAGARELGETQSESVSSSSLGYIHHKLGDLPRAAACYERTSALGREIGDRYNEAYGLEYLGEVQHDAGDIAAARQNWERALRILEQIHNPASEGLRARLR